MSSMAPQPSPTNPYASVDKTTPPLPLPFPILASLCGGEGFCLLAPCGRETGANWRTYLLKKQQRVQSSSCLTLTPSFRYLRTLATPLMRLKFDDGQCITAAFTKQTRQCEKGCGRVVWGGQNAGITTNDTHRTRWCNGGKLIFQRWTPCGGDNARKVEAHCGGPVASLDEGPQGRLRGVELFKYRVSEEGIKSCVKPFVVLLCP